MADEFIPDSRPIVTRAEAKSAGLNRYFTGRMCPHSHMSERFVSCGACLSCLKARGPADRVKRFDKQKIYNKAHYIRKKNAGLGRTKEQMRQLSKDYRAKNKDRVLEISRAWERRNRDYGLAKTRNRRALQKSADGTHTKTEILLLLQKQKLKCAYCNKSLKTGYHADHITPLTRGGSNTISNIALACASCNLRKSARDPIEWAQKYLNRLL
jgi:5-methylcytosine-specific restriction endonuclease McrA